MSITSHKPLLALTVRQPWAWAIAQGHKRVENRSWAPGPGTLQVGERFVIHAGNAAPEEHVWHEVRAGVWRVRGSEGRVEAVTLPPLVDKFQVPGTGFVRGALVAVATFAGIAHSRGQLEQRQRYWWQDPKGWLLANIIELAPISASGARGLWPLSGELQFQVLEQLGESKRAVST